MQAEQSKSWFCWEGAQAELNQAPFSFTPINTGENEGVWMDALTSKLHNMANHALKKAPVTTTLSPSRSLSLPYYYLQQVGEAS